MDVNEYVSETCTKFSINRLEHQFSCVVQKKTLQVKAKLPTISNTTQIGK